jgi:hypothetical protein
LTAMAQETSSADRPLELHEALEAEYTELHGNLPAKYPSSNDRKVRLQAFYAAVHGLEEKRAALCISGGGIRSATFGLGVLQGLARCGLLDKFDYLSTVSGGGYIGSWLSAWIRNHPQGAAGVATELKRRPDSTLQPEPKPVRHLREFSNYLSPRTGLTSVDFWTLIATFIRNIFLNWLVLISWLAAAMMIPRLYLAAINIEPNWSTWTVSVGQRWDMGLTVLLAVGFVSVAVAMAYAIIDVPSTGNLRLSQSRFLLLRQLPLLLAALILAEWWALFRNVHGSEPFTPADWLPKFVGFSIASYLFGGLLAIVILRFRRGEARARRFIHSLLRLGTIVLTAAFAGFCLWLIATRMFLVPAANALNYVCFAPALILAVLLIVNFLFTGLASWVTQDEDREWWGRSAAWILITIFAWILVNVIVLWGAQALTAETGNQLAVFLGDVKTNPITKALLGALGGVSGIAAALLALRSKLSAKVDQKSGFQWLLIVVAVVFFVLLGVVISWVLLWAGSQPWAQRATAWLLRQEEPEIAAQNSWRLQLFVVFLLTGATLFFGIVMGFFINANKFSLHATYRNRLIRAYLAASRTNRDPSRVTGFDTEENI